MTDIATFPSTGAAALHLRVNGASYADIAMTLGLASARSALHVVTDELAEAGQLDTDAKERLRAEESARLEALMGSVMTKALDPEHPEHLVAVRAAVTVIDRHIKLHGLDAPSEVIVHTPTQTELENWVATMVHHTMPQLEEADVIDVSVDE